MQASYHIAILSAQELERHVQERRRLAERERVIRELREHRALRSSRLRVAFGGLVERFGRKISGSPATSERWVDVPGAISQPQ
jgi:hypothetical protein